MKILSLGHSCFLVSMESRAGGGRVRILADPWLSDHVVGDLMGRFPRVRFDPNRLAPIDGIFLSHAHTDHLDPYTLVRLYRELATPPDLLLPQSLEYLAPLLSEYLPAARIQLLRENETLDFRGVDVTALFNLELRATNEDDVMLLLLENGREIFLSESDAVLPFHDPEARAQISELLGRAEVETTCFLTTKNELEATMAMVEARSLEQREELRLVSWERTLEQIEEIFAGGAEEDGDLWQNPALVRLVTGQGIAFPAALETEWNRVLFPIRLEDRVRMERDALERYGLRAAVHEVLPGRWHRLASGGLQGVTPATEIECLDREEDRHFRPDLPLFEDFPLAPLRPESRDPSEQGRIILESLQSRFLPWLIGGRTPPVEHLLAAGGGEYRVRIRYGRPEDHHDQDFRITFADLRFQPAPAEGEADEHYWANDVDDYLRGFCDDFSTFCRRPLSQNEPRFWSCLGMPYLNNDLVAKKLRHHFERAARNESVDEWVLSRYRSP